jgi:3-methyladenine DNA glycosylase AlkD
MNQELIKAIKSQLDRRVNFEKADFLPRFFKAFPGGYGEGDQFLGVSVPDQRKIAKQFYKEITDKELVALLRDPIHEVRLTAVFMLVQRFDKAKTQDEQQRYVEIYINNLEGINNWDLVDSSAYHILGKWLDDKPRDILFEFAESGHLWKQRIAVIATYHFIRNDDFDSTLQLAEMLLHHEHDLIHKAVGWMLREVGNRDKAVEQKFLKKHYKNMPRTMLRYAIEKFSKEERQAYLDGSI